MKNRLLDLIAIEGFNNDNTVIYSNQYNCTKPSLYAELCDVNGLESFIKLDVVTIIDFEVNTSLNRLCIQIDLFELDELESGSIEVGLALAKDSNKLKDVLFGFNNWDEVKGLLNKYPFLEAVKFTRKVNGNTSYYKALETVTEPMIDNKDNHTVFMGDKGVSYKIGVQIKY